MKLLYFAILVLFSISKVSSQEIAKECGCSKDSLIQNIESCDDILLKDKSKLYYQFNCDSLWLTLKNNKGQKKIIYSQSGEDYKEIGNLNYRLGYQFSKEFSKSLLFRYGCPATGSCNFILIDKKTGKKVREFNQLIYDYENNAFLDFLIYFSSQKLITVEFIETGKQAHTPVNEKHFTQIIPEFQFDKIVVKNNILIMTYSYEENEIVKKATLKLDIRKYNR